MSGLSSPNGWRELPLATGVSISHGFAFKSENFRDFGEYAVTTPGNFFEEGGFKTTGVRQRYYDGVVSASTVFSPGELIVAMTEQADGLLGSAAVVPKDPKYLHNQRVGRVRCDSSFVQLDFLYWLMNSEAFRASVRETAAGTKVKHTSPLKLLSIPALVPPLHEQVRIGGVLREVSHLISSLQELIAKKKAIKQGMMQQLLTGKTRLPGFTGDWVNKPLRDLVAYEQPIRYLVANAGYGSNGTPVLTAGKTFILGYTAETDGIYDTLPVIIFDDFTTAAKFVSFPFKAKSSAMKMLTPKPGADLRFVFERMLHINFVAVDHKRRWIDEYSKLEVAVPPFEEQQAISIVIEDADAEIDSLKSRLTSVRAVKQGMMQELLTGRTRLIPTGESE